MKPSHPVVIRSVCGLRAPRPLPLRALLLLALLLLSTAAIAAPRAWLEPDRVTLGDTVTLNVERDGIGGDAPDFNVLERDFIVRGQSSSTQTRIGSGQRTTRTLYAVALEPRAAGVLAIPAFALGGASTEPLTLTVLPAVPGSAQRGDAVFLESQLDVRDPYVQQTVAYTVRLYYAVTLLDGELDAPAPDGASLQKVGEDRTYQREIGGHRYTVVERQFLLTPERSGPLQLPAPRFQGRAIGGDVFFGSRQNVRAIGTPYALQVRPQPAGAPAPWLPARDLQLDYTDASGQAHDADAAATPPSRNAVAGEPLMLSITLRADGVTSAQLPELVLPDIDGAQVFPEPPDTRDTIRDGRPQATVTRRFAVVPSASGTLRVPALRIGWWNTATDRAAATALPALTLDVAAGAATAVHDVPAGSGGAPAATSGTDDADSAALPSSSLRWWQGLCALLALLLALTGWWGWRRGTAPRPGPSSHAMRSAPATAAAPMALKRALADGDLHAIAAALRAALMPHAATLDEVGSRLDDPAQRAAIDALQRALWGGGDALAQQRAVAREQLRQAFARGLQLRDDVAAAPAAALPPLYPRH